MIGVVRIVALIYIMQAVAQKGFKLKLIPSQNDQGYSADASDFGIFHIVVHCTMKDGGPSRIGYFHYKPPEGVEKNLYLEGRIYRMNYEECEDLHLLIWMGRKGNTRENENPIHYIPCAEYYKYYETTDAMGTGLDFGDMYNEAPIHFQEMGIYRRVEGWKDLIRDLGIINSTWLTGTWIANEGIYALDLKTKDFYPLYYLPHYRESGVIT